LKETGTTKPPTEKRTNKAKVAPNAPKAISVPKPPRDPESPRPYRGRKPAFRSGFVSVLGRPNAGKSTLINAIAGTKVAIVSPKPQTTRMSLQAIVNRPNAQIVFIDTPGVHVDVAAQKASLLHSKMMEAVRTAARDQDLLIWLADATVPFAESSLGLEMLRHEATPAILVANKIDRIPGKQHLLPLLELYGKVHPFQEFLPVSALTGEGLPELEKAILSRLPKGPQFFPDDQITDAPERFHAAEMIREQVLLNTGQEVPHHTAIVIEQWEEKPKLLHVGAAIHVERAGQKRIIIGSGGAMLKQIGTKTREQLEERYGKKVFLELFVKVQPGWRESPSFLAELDWRS
jgi:GTPase